ncbi:hypothetical protein BKA61DRAFT_467353 [Leptodontidium sp. MPI-SDFR-AT-0119]|nr:hypothetical protein BKA61DRAFT_467353 [Leptodontidium sp. MPI-SDFR-AT-0119]
MSRQASTDLIHAYRQLYRGLLHAVQYSKPARYLARDQLRNAFRKGDPASFDQQKVTRTIEFFKYAAEEKGLEHRIVKTLLQTSYWEAREEHRLERLSKFPVPKEVRRTARTHYNMTLAMLNDSMGLCLR